MIFGNPTETPRPASSRTEQQAAGEHRNSNVSKILPLTTFRTIDLAGRKNSGPLFSRFCVKMRVFFELFPAPESVHNQTVWHQRRMRVADRKLELASAQ
jgi:hypothetical protein